jgi:hypothetical protein
MRWGLVSGDPKGLKPPFAVSRLLSEWTQLGIIDARREAILVHDTLRLIDFAREEHATCSSH